MGTPNAIVRGVAGRSAFAPGASAMREVRLQTPDAPSDGSKAPFRFCSKSINSANRSESLCRFGMASARCGVDTGFRKRSCSALECRLPQEELKCCAV